MGLPFTESGCCCSCSCFCLCSCPCLVERWEYGVGRDIDDDIDEDMDDGVVVYDIPR